MSFVTTYQVPRILRFARLTDAGESFQYPTSEWKAFLRALRPWLTPKRMAELKFELRNADKLLVTAFIWELQAEAPLRPSTRDDVDRLLEAVGP